MTSVCQNPSNMTEMQWRSFRPLQSLKARLVRAGGLLQRLVGDFPGLRWSLSALTVLYLAASGNMGHDEGRDTSDGAPIYPALQQVKFTLCSSCPQMLDSAGFILFIRSLAAALYSCVHPQLVKFPRWGSIFTTISDYACRCCGGRLIQRPVTQRPWCMSCCLGAAKIGAWPPTAQQPC